VKVVKNDGRGLVFFPSRAAKFSNFPAIRSEAQLKEAMKEHGMGDML
jgi:hypothetical protein